MHGRTFFWTINCTVRYRPLDRLRRVERGQQVELFPVNVKQLNTVKYENLKQNFGGNQQLRVCLQLRIAVVQFSTFALDNLRVKNLA